MTVHGGGVWQAGEELGISASELLDFSANINPRGLPPRAMERLKHDASDCRLLRCYPDPSARRLRHALSEKLGVSPDAIAIGPGAEALLAPVLRCLQPGRTLVPVPAFGEYRRVCEQQQIEFAPFALDRSELFRVPVDRLCARIESESPGLLLLLNNPHNPSGAMLEAHEIRPILDRSPLLLDEAFIDYVPRASLVREAATNSALIVIRSLTKFYGCPALRIGYVVSHPDTIQCIQSLLPTWPVTQLATDALAEAITDEEYADASRRENVIERQWLANALGALGLFVFPSAANYLLIELRTDMPAASKLSASLIVKHRILIRNCDSYEGLGRGRYVRVAVRSHKENCLLIEALTDELKLS